MEITYTTSKQADTRASARTHTGTHARTCTDALANAKTRAKAHEKRLEGKSCRAAPDVLRSVEGEVQRSAGMQSVVVADSSFPRPNESMKEPVSYLPTKTA